MAVTTPMVGIARSSRITCPFWPKEPRSEWYSFRQFIQARAIKPIATQIAKKIHHEHAFLAIIPFIKRFLSKLRLDLTMFNSYIIPYKHSTCQ
jgi:hypothetical protein